MLVADGVMYGCASLMKVLAYSVPNLYWSLGFVFFFFKQKTAYEMRISDWSSDVCSSDLPDRPCAGGPGRDADRSRRRPRPGPGHRSRRGACPSRRGEIGRASCRERVCQYV